MTQAKIILKNTLLDAIPNEEWRSNFKIKWIKRVDGVNPEIASGYCFLGDFVNNDYEVKAYKSGIYLVYAEGYVDNPETKKNSLCHLVSVFQLECLSDNKAKAYLFFHDVIPRKENWAVRCQKPIFDKMTALAAPQMEEVAEPFYNHIITPGISQFLKPKPQPLSYYLIQAKFTGQSRISKAKIKDIEQKNIDQYRMEFALYYNIDLAEVPLVRDLGDELEFHFNLKILISAQD